jgi:hypothetical protein
MRVMTQLRPEAARELRSAQTGQNVPLSPETRQLAEMANQLGVKLEPVHPGNVHSSLIPYYMIEAPDQETVDKLLEGLGQLNIVEAAYVKPDEQLP